MRLSDFQYELPHSMIAQAPPAERDRSRLLYLNAKRKAWDHRSFRDLPALLRRNDVLVVNDTKVFPARLFGRKPTGGKIEVFLLKQINETDWRALVHPSYKFKEGTTISVDGDAFVIEAVDRHISGDGVRTVRLHTSPGRSWQEELAGHGHVPLPPYIKRPDQTEDRMRYQTVYADKVGAVAAPTAGLHFTAELLDVLRARGVQIVCITLHVGSGTFRPVKTERLEDHVMHKEWFSISAGAARAINERKGRLVACGTTALRAMESALDGDGRIQAVERETDLFIYPPYTFRTADLLITNFHLPGSTLLMLVAAFGGHEFITNAYEEAKKTGYRFYSYGDAMLIERI